MFDHAAIATREPAKLKRILSLLGLSDDGSESVPSEGVTTHFLSAGEGTTAVELLESVDPKGAVGRFLDKRGPGIHHLSFRVKGLEKLSDELRAQGVRLVYDSPRPGAHGTRVNFLHPESTGGVLIEIAEEAS